MRYNVKTGYSITNASGDDMDAKYVVHMDVSKFKNKRKVVNKLIIKNMRIVLDVKYNLFSISKRLK